MISKIINFYKKQIVKGLFWVGSIRAVTRIFTVVRTAVLARLLSPADFGSFGIALLALSAIETFTETGVNVVLIQEKKSINDYINTAWIVSIIRGFIIGFLLILAAPLIAYFFNDPSSLFLLILIGLVPIIRGFINPSIVKFEKDLEFHVNFWIQTSTFLVDSIVSIVLTFIFRSPMGLVIGLLSGAILEVILSFILARPAPKPFYERQKFFQVLHSGKWVTAFSGFDFLSTQLDDVVVGRILNVTNLGFYQMAYRISILPITEISNIFNKVAFPLYSKMYNKKTLLSTFLKIQGVLSLIVVPVCILIFMFPEKIIEVLLGNNWLMAAPALKILSIYGGVRAIFGATSSLFLSLHHQRFVAISTFVRFFGLGVTIVPLTLMFGLVGASFSALFSALLELPFILTFLIMIFRNREESNI